MGKYRMIIDVLFKKQYVRMKDLYMFFIFAIILLATYKYIAYPEPYTFEISRLGNRIEIGDNIIRQDIVINEKSRWDGESYISIYFSVDSKLDEGQIEVSLLQDNKIVQNHVIKRREIITGFCPLDDLEFSRLKKGIATIEIRGVKLNKPVYLEVSENKYNLPNCYINNKEISDILVQKYHFYILNFEFDLRRIFYGLFAIINSFMLLVIGYRREDKKTCLFAQITLIFSYICLMFIYDSSLLFSPTWAEAVTNFAHNAINVGIKRNLLIMDAGYWPLIQRLITLFIFRILNVQPHYALFLMQTFAYVISGYFLSFFVKWQFRDYWKLKNRYLLSLLFLMQIIDRQTGAFINFMVYGIFPILLYFLANNTEWGGQRLYLLVYIRQHGMPFKRSICYSTSTNVS